MIKIKNLTISLAGDKIIDNLSLHIKKGEVLGIIGESGAGKTTLGLSVVGLSEMNPTGEILVQNENILNYDAKTLKKYRWKKAAMVFQHINDSLNPMTPIIEQIVEPMLDHKVYNKGQAVARAKSLLSELEIDEKKFKCLPHQLSGGERQRVLIGMAMANDPDILIFDEPTSALDSITKKQVLDKVKKFSRDKSALFITHDISAAEMICDKIAVLYAGKILEVGDTKDVLKNPRHPYTRALLRSYTGMKTTKDLQGIKGNVRRELKGCPFNNRCTQRTEKCREVVPELKLYGERRIACHRKGIVSMIQISHLFKDYDEIEVLNDVDFNVLHGETLAVVGESGSGKSTLARCIMGVEPIGGGEIKFDGKTVKDRPLEFYKNVQIVYQDPKSSINPRLTVYESIKEPLDIHRLGSEPEKKERIISIMKDVHLPTDETFLRKHSYQLSGGELQRIALARALIINPKLIIADEFTSALDISVQAKILKLILGLQEKRGLSMIFITHDIAVARKVSDKVIVMKKGRIIENGSASEIMEKPKSKYMKELLNAVLGGVIYEKNYV